MNIFGILRNGARACDSFSAGSATEGAGHLLKAGMAVVPGANLVLGGTVDKAFGISAIRGAAEETVSHIEMNYHKAHWQDEVDAVGNQNGIAEPEDIIVAANDQFSNVMEGVNKAIDFIADI
jgi:hypothetical protein